MLKYRSGNILDSHMQTLVNAVNTVGAMGKGLALQFKKKYPDMYQEYRQMCDRGELTTGKLHLFRASDHWILNFPTKAHYRSKSKLRDIEEGLKELRKSYKIWGIESMAIPALGCGYGGLEWYDVRQLIARYLGDLPIPIEVYEPWTKSGQYLEKTKDVTVDNDRPTQLGFLDDLESGGPE